MDKPGVVCYKRTIRNVKKLSDLYRKERTWLAGPKLANQLVDVDGKHGRRQIASMPISQYNLLKATIY